MKNSESQSTLDATELLSQLKGIQLPEAPVAADLKLLYLCLVICAIALIVLAKSRFKSRQTWHKAALSKLKDLQSLPDQDSLHQTAILLKRITISEGDRIAAQHLTGELWLKYLDKFFSTDFFSAGGGRVFGSALYRAGTTPEKNLHANLRRLIKRHRRNQS